MLRALEERYYDAAKYTLDGHLSIPGTDPAGLVYTTRNSNSRLALTTSARAIGVRLASTHVTPAYARGGLWSDTFTEIVPASVATTSAISTVEAQLGATETARAVQVVAGSSIYDAFSPTARYATSIQGVYVPEQRDDGTTSAASSIASPTRPTTRIAVLGNSISDGFVTPQFAHDSPVAQLRAAVAGTVGVTSLSCGFESIHNLTGSALSTTVARVLAEMDGTSANYLWIALGTNDYGASLATAAATAAALGALIDAIHAARPDITIYLQTPIQRISPSTEAANGYGETLPQHRAALSGLTTGRGWLTVIDGSAGKIVSDANIYSDGIHATKDGAAQIEAKYRAVMGV